MVFNPLHLLGKLFWVDHGGSLPVKVISIMDLGYCIQMNPLNTFLWPLEASRRPKTGLKVANFHGFETCTLSGKAFFGWTRQHPVADFLTLEIVIREAFKKKTKKVWNFPNRAIPNFFLDFFGFFLKPLGKHWKWPDSSRNAKKKISLL